ncbi:MAG TPA: DHA2 family efflux MFS transporter permease subunit [Candidatus Sulfotelmatobacter sp.]|nr:DHA2 family efflux MFS transporter permease subunit [Candidatus Sulfotelmatobacter sp.]
MSAVAERGPALGRAAPEPPLQPPLHLHPDPVRNPWVIIGVIMVGYFLGPLYSSVANVALPNLVAAFGSDIDTMEWVVTGYMLGYSISMPVAGWLADTLGRRRVYLAGLALFAVASILASFAWDANSIIVFRILQAVGGGLVSPTAMAIIMDVVPPAQRGRALGVWGMGMMLAPSFGPTISGWIVDNLDDWRPIFLIGVPLAILGFVLALAKIPHDEDALDKPAPPPFDVPGFSLLSTALAAFLIPLSQADRVGWDDGWIQLSLAVAALAFVGFLWRELRTPAPMMALSLFAERTFALAVGLRAIVGMGYYFAIFLLPLFTQDVLGWTPTLSGLVLMPAGIVMALLMPVAGTLSDKIGSRPFVLAGVVIATAGTFLFARIDVDWSFSRIATDALIRTGALGLLFTPLTTVALSVVPRNRSGQASGILNTVWQVGGSVGIAIGQTYLTAKTALHLSENAGAATLAHPGFVQGLSAMATHVPAHVAQILAAQQVAMMSQVQAYGDTFLFATVVMALGIPAAMLLPGRKRA